MMKSRKKTEGARKCAVHRDIEVGDTDRDSETERKISHEEERLLNSSVGRA